MIFVGIDVAKDKHDCCILDSAGELVTKVFTIANDREGFEFLLNEIRSFSHPTDKVKVGLEATGHYSKNITRFLIDNGLAPVVINPLHTNFYRKCLSLRQAKTDKIDARTIAMMLMSDAGLKPYTDKLYHNDELKSLTRLRFSEVHKRSKLKQSLSRLVNITFPELESLVSSIHTASIYAILSEFPGAKQIADSHLTRLKSILEKASKGRFGRDKALEIRDAARKSVGTASSATSLEIKHAIQQIQLLKKEIAEIEAKIKEITDAMASPILSIPGIKYRMGAIILAEIGDFSNFDSPDKILAYAGLAPSVHQSGKMNSAGAYSHMEKRGSKYLRYALINAAKYVCKWIPEYGSYLEKKRGEGKHYNVAISHVAKKLVRLIFALQTTGSNYRAA